MKRKMDWQLSIQFNPLEFLRFFFIMLINKIEQIELGLFLNS